MINGRKSFYTSSAKTSDVPELLHIAKVCGLSRWNAIGFLNALSDPDSVLLCLRHQTGSVTGFILGRISTKVGLPAEVYNIGIIPERRRQGLGGLLLTAFISRCIGGGTSEIWLEVRESNNAAIQFYDSMGFISAGVRKNFYSEPTENAILMTLLVEQFREIERLDNTQGKS